MSYPELTSGADEPTHELTAGPDFMSRLSRIDAIRETFLADAYPAAGAGLVRTTSAASSSAPTDGGAVFCGLVGPDVLHAKPLLALLFAKVAAGGGATLDGQLRGYLRWSVWADHEVPVAKLTVRLMAPVRVAVDLLVECAPCWDFLWRAAQGGFVALAEADRAETFIDGRFVADLDRCLVLTAPRSTALTDLIDKMGWPRPKP